MSTAEIIRSLADEVHRMVHENITPDGECLFDPVKTKLALEFVKLEIEKSIKREVLETD